MTGEVQKLINKETGIGAFVKEKKYIGMKFSDWKKLKLGAPDLYAELKDKVRDATVIKIDYDRLKKAKLAFIFRENDLYNPLFDEVQKQYGDKAYVVAIPRETQELAPNDAENLLRLTEFGKKQKIGMYEDTTVSRWYDDTNINIYQTDYERAREISRCEPDVLPKWHELYTGSAKDNAEKFADSLREMTRRAKTYGIERIAIAYNQLSGHGVTVLKDGKEVHYDGNAAEEAVETIYHYINGVMEKEGLQTFRATNDYWDNLYALDKNENRTKVDVNEKIGIFVDRHAGGSLVRSLKGAGAFFIKHENEVIEDKKAGNFIPEMPISELAKNLIDVIRRKNDELDM